MTEIPNWLSPMTRGFSREPQTPTQVAQSAQATTTVSNALTRSVSPTLNPLKQYDYEQKIQEAQQRATELQGQLKQQRFQQAISQAQAQGVRQWNKNQRQWQNQMSNAATDPMFRSIKHPTPEFQAFAKAIAQQETGGLSDPYGAKGVSVNGGDRALGKYQIMASNIQGRKTGWDYDVLGRDITTQRFLNRPMLQDRIALAKLQGLFQRHGVQGGAASWYGGESHANDWQRQTGSQGEFPSIANYANEVYARYNKILPHIQAQQATISNVIHKQTGLRGITSPLKGSANWGFGSEGDWGSRSIGQGFHTGIDFDAPIGTPVYASQSGRISTANWDNGYGNQIFVNGKHRSQTRYQHLSKFAKGVNKGDFVQKGQLIGYVGDTGSYSEGPHLHFETLRHLPNTSRFDPRRIEQGWTSVNPLKFFRKRYHPYHE